MPRQVAVTLRSPPTTATGDMPRNNGPTIHLRHAAIRRRDPILHRTILHPAATARRVPIAAVAAAMADREAVVAVDRTLALLAAGKAVITNLELQYLTASRGSPLVGPFFVRIWVACEIPAKTLFADSCYI
jgi:hypothetical protein